MRSLGPDELLRLLLKGGISTSGAITEVSGRGIGLDVVREAAERLGGTVAVETEAGKGTVMEVIVPVSLSSLNALMVEASGVSAAIPLDAVLGTLRVDAKDVARIAEGQSIVYEGRVIPFMPLHRPLARNGRVGHTARKGSAVVIHSPVGTAAVAVDKLLGTGTVVLRPLPASRLPIRLWPACVWMHRATRR
jgi:two-component system chemotaxis sensor kinase CheA